MPAMTTRGVKEVDTVKIVDFIDRTLKNHDNEEILASIKQEVIEFCKDFPVPGLVL
jgi:glycine hydroxymethyltransferase